MQFILPVAIVGSLTADIRNIIYKLSQLVQWMSQKEIPVSSIENAKTNSIELVCLIEKYLPTSILTIQVHLLVHLVDEVAMAGTVHCRWMFFLERFLKTLKGFVRQRACPEGSMAEGWLIQESLVYITKFLTKENFTMPALWTMEDDSRVAGEVLQGNDKEKLMDDAMIDKVNKFCMLQHQSMQKWLSRYERARKVRENDRRAFRTSNRNRHTRYPPGLEELPDSMPLEWLHEELIAAEARGHTITSTEWHFSYGCSRKVFKIIVKIIS